MKVFSPEHIPCEHSAYFSISSSPKPRSRPKIKTFSIATSEQRDAKKKKPKHPLYSLKIKNLTHGVGKFTWSGDSADRDKVRGSPVREA